MKCLRSRKHSFPFLCEVFSGMLSCSSLGRYMAVSGNGFTIPYIAKKTSTSSWPLSARIVSKVYGIRYPILWLHMCGKWPNISKCTPANVLEEGTCVIKKQLRSLILCRVQAQVTALCFSASQPQRKIKLQRDSWDPQGPYSYAE